MKHFFQGETISCWNSTWVEVNKLTGLPAHWHSSGDLAALCVSAPGSPAPPFSGSQSSAGSWCLTCRPPPGHTDSLHMEILNTIGITVNLYHQQFQYLLYMNKITVFTTLRRNRWWHNRKICFKYIFIRMSDWDEGHSNDKWSDECKPPLFYSTSTGWLQTGGHCADAVTMELFNLNLG